MQTNILHLLNKLLHHGLNEFFLLGQERLHVSDVERTFSKFTPLLLLQAIANSLLKHLQSVLSVIGRTALTGC